MVGIFYIGEVTLMLKEYGDWVAFTWKAVGQYLDHGYYVTMSDNWFTSVQLAQKLASHRMTLLGTV